MERRGVKKTGASELHERRPPINPARLPRKEAKFLRNVGFWLPIVDVCRLHDLQERSARKPQRADKKSECVGLTANGRELSGQRAHGEARGAHRKENTNPPANRAWRPRR